MLWYTNCSKN